MESCPRCGRANCTGGRGCAISAAKRGRKQIERDPDELTVVEAAAETGLSRKVIGEGGESGKLRCCTVPRPGRQSDVLLFKREELFVDLAGCPCSYPGCSRPAPGNSGRCGDHCARVLHPTVELTCEYCGQPFTRAGSTMLSPGYGTRGRFCGDRCKGLAGDAERLRTLNLSGAHAYHVAVRKGLARQLKHARSAGLLSVEDIAKRLLAYRPATIAQHARRGDVDGFVPVRHEVVDGHLLMLFEEEAVAAYETWLAAGDGRRRIHADLERRRARNTRAYYGDDRRIMSARLATHIAAQNRSDPPGRPRLPASTRDAILGRAGEKADALAAEFGVSRRTVYNIWAERAGAAA